MPGRAKHDDTHIIAAIRRAAVRPSVDTRLERRIVDAIPPSTRFVLIGEASHGTDEFYRMRAEFTQALIQERGFHAVCVEVDFPDAFRANMYARGLGGDATPEAALDDFIRFPTWMWRNTAVRDFLAWLRCHNDAVPGQGAGPGKVGFYGMDLYSLHSSAKRVVEFLRGVDAPAAERAAARYRCFDRYGEDTMAYAQATAISHKASCAPEAVSVLLDVLGKTAEHATAADGEAGREAAFQAACNASVVAGAEQYYRNMFFGDELTWNLRDGHFADTVARVAAHVKDREGCPAKLVLWAHNSHLGDARATDMGQHRGEINLGQLMRERYPAQEVRIKLFKGGKKPAPASKED